MNPFKKKLLLWPVALFLFAGCISDELEGCINTDLYFEYPDFPARIERVHVSFFDEQGHSVRHHLVEQAALRSFQGVRTLLNPGEYTVVCWGNANENTRLEGFDADCHIDNYSLFHSAHEKSATITTSDSLFHHISSLSIPEGGKRDTLHFAPAHIRLQVVTVGFETNNYIRINNLQTVYNGRCTPGGNPVSYYPVCRAGTEEKRLEALCDVLRFTTNNTIEVEILEHETNAQIYLLRMQEYLLQNNIQIEEGKEYHLIITIRYNDGNITVDINQWGGKPVEPELN